MTTLLEICQDAIAEVTGFDTPETVAGNLDDVPSALMSAARRVGREMHLACDWQALRRTRSFTLSPGVDNYPLPADFGRMVERTIWDMTIRRELAGPATAMEWQAIRSIPLMLQATYWWRVVDNKFMIFPSPGNNNTVSYEYTSKYWCKSSSGVEQDRWRYDSDTTELPASVFISGVRYWFKLSKGLPFGDDKAEYYGLLDIAKANEAPHRVINVGLPLGRIYG